MRGRVRVVDQEAIDVSNAASGLKTVVNVLITKENIEQASGKLIFLLKGTVKLNFRREATHHFSSSVFRKTPESKDN